MRCTLGEVGGVEEIEHILMMEAVALATFWFKIAWHLLAFHDTLSACTGIYSKNVSLKHTTGVSTRVFGHTK